MDAYSVVLIIYHHRVNIHHLCMDSLHQSQLRKPGLRPDQSHLLPIRSRIEQDGRLVSRSPIHIYLFN